MSDTTNESKKEGAIKGMILHTFHKWAADKDWETKNRIKDGLDLTDEIYRRLELFGAFKTNKDG